jgi:hypothetical protein
MNTMRISLVGTVHASSDLASIGELQAILDRVRPKVIFAEIPVTHVGRYRDGSHGTLESTVVARYLASHQADVEPVDLAKPEQKFFDDAEDMFRAVSRTNPDYRRLIDRNSAEIQAGGFHYLNSDECVQAWADIYREVLATIEWIGDHRLRQIYELWKDTNERRDQEMMRHIVLYSGRNAMARGVFLVGAAHRKSIIDKAFAGSGTGAPRIEWDLSEFLEAVG